MRNLAVVFFILIISVSVVAVGIDNPSIVDYMEAEVYQSGNVNVGSGGLSLQLDIYIPQNTNTQKVEILEASTDYTLEEDKYGNQLVRFYWNKPKDVTEFWIKSNVIVTRQEKMPIGNEKFFSNPTDLIESGKSEIIDFAENITIGKKGFEKIGELGKWVNTNIEYDLKYKDVNLSGTEVLETRSGVCSEYSTLFESFARSIGFETRSVLGYVISQYQEPYDFEAHSWSEVKMDDNYIPVDSTWAEGGVVDATHIKFATFPDAIFNQATAKATSTRSNTGGIKINIDTEISILNFSSDPIVGVNNFVLDNNLWSGSAVVKSELTYSDCVLMKVKKISCGIGNDFLLDIRDPDEVIYFCGEKDHFTIFDIPNNLKSTTFYTCPINVYPNLGLSDTIDLTLKNEFDYDNKIGLGVSSNSILPGEKVVLNSEDNLVFTSDGDWAIGNLVIAPKNNVYVYAYNNGYLVEERISVVNTKPFVLSVEANDTMIYGNNYTVNVSIENLVGYPQEIKIKISDKEDVINVDADSKKIVEFLITAENPVVQVFGETDELSTSSSKEINLLIQKSFIDDILNFINRIVFNVSVLLGALE